MTDIFISIRTQKGNALTSIDGIPFVALLGQEGRIIAEQTVDLRDATAYFQNLPPGEYVTNARHERVEPEQVSLDITVMTVTELVQGAFIYSEPQRIFLRTNIRLLSL